MELRGIFVLGGLSHNCPSFKPVCCLGTQTVTTLASAALVQAIGPQLHPGVPPWWSGSQAVKSTGNFKSAWVYACFEPVVTVKELSVLHSWTIARAGYQIWEDFLAFYPWVPFFIRLWLSWHPPYTLSHGFQKSSSLHGDIRNWSQAST